MTYRKRIFLLNDLNMRRIDAALAIEIGLTPSIVLLQLEFRIAHARNDDKHIHDGHKWTWQSISDIQEDLPWLGRTTINQAIRELVERKLILVGNFNQRKGDRTRWFALDYDGLARLESIQVASVGAAEDEPRKKSEGSGRNSTAQNRNGTAQNRNGTTLPPTSTTISPATSLPARSAQAENLDEPEHVPVDEETGEPLDEFSPGKKLHKWQVPETDLQREFLSTIGARKFKPRQKSRLKRFEGCFKVAAVLPVGGVAKCLEELEAYTGEGLPDRRFSVPKSWWGWRKGHARSHQWSGDGWLNALENRDALVTHCRYQLRKTGAPVPPVELAREWSRGESEQIEGVERVTGLPGLWNDGTRYDGTVQPPVSEEKIEESLHYHQYATQRSAAESLKEEVVNKPIGPGAWSKEEQKAWARFTKKPHIPIAVLAQRYWKIRDSDAEGRGEAHNALLEAMTEAGVAYEDREDAAQIARKWLDA